MPFGLKDAMTRNGRDKVAIGIDLTDTYSQLSFAVNGEAPQTMHAAAGEERLCIPTVLAKRYAENVWTYGIDAMALESAQDGVLVDSLLSRARSGRAVMIDGTEYDPTDLLALFLRKCLGRLLAVAPLEKVAAIVISVAVPDERMIKVLSDVVRILRLKKERVFFQSHAESAFHYIRNQSKDLTTQEMLICDLTTQGMDCMLFRENFHSTPHVMLLTQKHFAEFLPETLTEEAGGKIRAEQKDHEFKALLYSLIEGHVVSATYLLGDGFDGGWYEESLAYICRNSRVFRGNNLFSQGACYGALEKMGDTSGGEEKIVFLGKDKLKANIGIRVERAEGESYLPLIDAGNNWYDSRRECELITDTTDRIELLVTPLDGKEARMVTVYLDGLPVRGNRATRLRVELRMTSETKAELKVTDLGFGEFFPSTGKKWQKIIEFS